MLRLRLIVTFDPGVLPRCLPDVPLSPTAQASSAVQQPIDHGPDNRTLDDEVLSGCDQPQNT